METQANLVIIFGSLVLSSRENTFSFENLKQMHRMKTALLISFSCEAGAIIGLAKQQEKKAFREYGEYLGMAFQIIDDVLDLTGDKKLIGKNLGSDKSNNSITYLKAIGTGIRSNLNLICTQNKNNIINLNLASKYSKNFIANAAIIIPNKT